MATLRSHDVSSGAQGAPSSGLVSRPHPYNGRMEQERRNPLDEFLTFPEAAVYLRQDILPSESNGWGLHLLLELPRRMVEANLDAQLTTAGFAAEVGVAQPGLLRFMREDAYVWGMVADAGGGRTSLLVHYTGKAELEEDEEPGL